jgi:hypothetical protein
MRVVNWKISENLYESEKIGKLWNASSEVHHYFQQQLVQYTEEFQGTCKDRIENNLICLSSKSDFR